MNRLHRANGHDGRLIGYVYAQDAGDVERQVRALKLAGVPFDHIVKDIGKHKRRHGLGFLANRVEPSDVVLTTRSDHVRNVKALSKLRAKGVSLKTCQNRTFLK